MRSCCPRGNRELSRALRCKPSAQLREGMFRGTASGVRRCRQLGGRRFCACWESDTVRSACSVKPFESRARSAAL